jgi:hypothetical protein
LLDKVKTDERRAYYIGKYCSLNKQKHGTNRFKSRDADSAPLEKPLKDISDELDVPERTIQANEQFAKGVDIIGSVDEGIKKNNHKSTH